ncbi:MAG: hypothetical protein ABW199_11430 [Caulobacterales bacterium]
MYQLGDNALKRANEYIANDNFVEASWLTTRISDAVQDGYLSKNPPVMDDTELHLDFAKERERTGDIKRAALIRRDILQDRLQLYREFACRE